MENERIRQRRKNNEKEGKKKMIKSEYEKACYSIGIKQNNISDDLIELW